MTQVEQEKIVKRKIIKIDEDLCTGCGNCVLTCAEAALEVIDGKAKVVNDVFCDGLGACLGECPEGALEIIEREAVEFDEEAVEKRLESLNHKESIETDQVRQVVTEHAQQCGCPSAQTMVFDEAETQTEVSSGKIPSALRQWPVQMHLINPTAPYYQGADVLLSADCVGFSYGDFHRDFIKQKSIAIA
ncbi:MAG: 4Fe-4S binding protein, partial [Candidatus Lokiarchaeota archaeon]|nr:4Fe-4S binding protein [Candidatus Lokiarchaeota archaeon]